MKKTFALMGGALAILGFNLFALAPWITRHFGTGSAQACYMTVRIGVFIGLGFTLGRLAGRTRFQTLTSTALVGLVDHVVFVGIVFAFGLGGSGGPPPEATPLAIGFGLLFQYFVYVPVILVLTFLGHELQREKSRRPAQ